MRREQLERGGEKDKDGEENLDVGVVVVVGAAGNRGVGVGHLDELGVGTEILRARHGDELNGVLEKKLDRIATGEGEGRRRGEGRGEEVRGFEGPLSGYE